MTRSPGLLGLARVTLHNSLTPLLAFRAADKDQQAYGLQSLVHQHLRQSQRQDATGICSDVFDKIRILPWSQVVAHQLARLLATRWSLIQSEACRPSLLACWKTACQQVFPRNPSLQSCLALIRPAGQHRLHQAEKWRPF